MVVYGQNLCSQLEIEDTVKRLVQFFQLITIWKFAYLSAYYNNNIIYCKAEFKDHNN